MNVTHAHDCLGFTFGSTIYHLYDIEHIISPLWPQWLDLGEMGITILTLWSYCKVIVKFKKACKVLITVIGSQ